MVSRVAVTAVRSADGLRRVLPYSHVFKTHAKRRWLGRRVLDVMACEFPSQATPTYLQGALAEGRILVNSQPCEQTTVFRESDVLEHHTLRSEPPVRAPPAGEWVLHLSPQLVVIDKPATVPVHAAGRFAHNTVVSILADECEPLRAAGLAGLFVIHRLDRETSGLLILGRTASAARQLSAQFRDSQVSKRYVALVDGEFPDGVHVVDAPLRREVLAGVGTNGVHPQGKAASTEFVRLSTDRAANTSIVLCSPRTGRTHQIRIHLQWLGHPISNDALYGGSRATAGSHNLLFAQPPSTSLSSKAPTPSHLEPMLGSGAVAAADSEKAVAAGSRAAGSGAAAAAGSRAAVGQAEEEGDEEGADELESASIFLHAVDYRLNTGAADAWHYCAPLPPWASELSPSMIGDGYSA
ncbi:pseudouridine synthase [Pavlovales sp. CCMP2436]|nr:pseudouridine synthase [Pavlovales sp. CCMP2436]